MTSNHLYTEALSAIREQKDTKRGRELLIELLRTEPNHDMAWAWLARVTNDPSKKQRCIEKALQINPRNEMALKLQERVEQTAFATGSMPIYAGSGGTLYDEKPEKKSATDSALGKPLLRTTVNWFRQVQKIVFFVILMAFLLRIALPALNNPRLSMENRNALIALTVCAVLLVVLILWSMLVAMMQYLVIYERGIEHNGLFGKTTLHYKDLTEIKMSNQRIIYRAFYVIPVYQLRIFEITAKVKGKGSVTINRDYAQPYELGEVFLRLTANLPIKRNFPL